MCMLKVVDGVNGILKFKRYFSLFCNAGSCLGPPSQRYIGYTVY